MRVIRASRAISGKALFVTCSYDLEEPRNLELETKTALGRPDGGNHFGASALELEYGVNAWWTSELYLDGQATSQDSTVFTGFRLENRFCPDGQADRTGQIPTRARSTSTRPIST